MIPPLLRFKLNPSPIVRFAANDKRRYKDVLSQPDAAHRGYGTYHYGNCTRDPDLHVGSVLGTFCQPGDAVLELGMNSGNNAIRLANIGYNVFGVDISRLAMRAVYKDPMLRAPENLHAALWDFAENPNTLPPEWADVLPDSPHPFKAIVAVHTLSHLSSQRMIQVMQGYVKRLAPGGVVIATIIKPSPSRDRVAEDNQNLRYGYIEHSDETLAKAFEGMEFQEEHSRAFEPRELSLWKLPRAQVHWVVYRKPPATETPADPAAHDDHPRFSGNKDRQYEQLFAEHDASQRGYGLFPRQEVTLREPDAHLLQTLDQAVPLVPGTSINLLELGINTGGNAIALAKKGYKVFGVDISRTPINALTGLKAQHLRPDDHLETAVWDFAESPIGLPPEWTEPRGGMKGFFHAIYSILTLSHLTDNKLNEVIHGLKPFLAPGGVFATTMMKPYARGVRFVEATAAKCGVHQHTQTVIDKAFTGYDKLPQYSRPFHQGEVKLWNIDDDFLHWDVYRKPLKDQ